MNKVIQCQALRKAFKEGDQMLVILKNIDFAITSHETIAILGASGSGKSTLLHLLGGLDRPTSGTVLWREKDIQTLSENQKCRLRNKSLGFVYQFHHLLPEFTALENVALPLLIGGIQTGYAQEKAKHLLEQVGLKDRLQHQPGELSGGERQRVAIARALVHNPQCILADEPTGNLDQANAEQVSQLMLDLQSTSGTSIIVVTHDERLAQKMQKCYRLENGELKG